MSINRLVSSVDEESRLMVNDLKLRITPWTKKGRHVVKRTGHACVR
jgi:hypothetical protein